MKSFSMSELEARKLKYPTTGTEALLMGIMTEGEFCIWFCLRWLSHAIVGCLQFMVMFRGRSLSCQGQDVHTLYSSCGRAGRQAQVKQQGSCAEMDLPYLECVKK